MVFSLIFFFFFFFFFNDTATTEIYTLSLHDALPISLAIQQQQAYSLEEKVAQLSEQILAMQGQPVKIPTYQLPQKRQQWQAKSEAKQGFICFNCQNEGHMAKDCNMPTRCGNCKRNGHTWKECPSIKCAKCGEKGHVAGNCHSEKINWLEDTVESLQILKRPTKQPEAVGLIAPLK